MQLEAIYNQGKLEFKQPVHFVHERFSILVTIPEAEIVKPPTEIKEPIKENTHSPSAAAVARLKKIRTIIGAHDYSRPPATVAQDKESYLEELEDKYL